jgi:xylulose-5-phosphate/fructose-6-phosphate phosphoketolase
MNSAKIDVYWRASNYLSVVQIYLLENPLRRTPLKIEHVKPHLARPHCGMTPGLNFIYVHLNRAIKAPDPSVVYIARPGKWRPAPLSWRTCIWRARTRRCIPTSRRIRKG